MKEVGSTGAVNCMACRVRVAVGDQRAHYRSEWHRVNLKRRVAGMAPISLREFEVRLTNMQNMAMEEEKQRVKGERKGFMCETCSKRFSSEKALVQHENSRRHMDKVQELHGVEGGRQSHSRNNKNNNTERSFSSILKCSRQARGAPLAPLASLSTAELRILR